MLSWLTSVSYKLSNFIVTPTSCDIFCTLTSDVYCIDIKYWRSSCRSLSNISTICLWPKLHASIKAVHLSCRDHSRSSVAGRSINRLSFSWAFSSWRGGTSPVDDSLSLIWLVEAPLELELPPELVDDDDTFGGIMLLCMASMKQVSRSLFRRLTSISGCWSSARTVSRWPEPHAYKRGVQPKQFRALTSTLRDLHVLESLEATGLEEYKRSLTRAVSPLSAALHNVNGGLDEEDVGLDYLFQPF